VQRGNLFHIDPDLMQRHTPRILDGAERLCAQLDTARARRPK
jgi:iron complex transport system substrate-binding protein